MAAIRVTELSVQELDGAPNVTGVQTIEVPNGSLTDNGGGSVSLTYGDLTEATADGRYLQKANNLSDVANAATARGSLGLGTAATHAAGDFAQTANNLSDLANAGTARTNLGLGTAATHAAGDFAQTANNLSDLASAATARTNLGLGTASTHAAGDFAAVANNLSDLANETTARSNLGAVALYTNAYASAPSSGLNAGDLWYPSDASIGFRYDGSAWVPLVANGKRILSSAFSWVNQGSATVADSGGGVYIHDPAESADSFRALVKSAPSTPYSLIIHWKHNLQHINYSGVAVFWRNSSNGKVQMAAMNCDTNVFNFAGTQGTLATSSWTFSSNPFTRLGATFYPFLKLRDDGTNLIISTSLDGANWEQVYSSGRTSFITSGPDQIGFAVESRNASSLPAGVLMLSWNEVAG